jgi:hypothetical protein
MTSEQLREAFDNATTDLDGDTGPVRRLVFDLARHVASLHRHLSEVEADLSRTKPTAAGALARVEALEVEVESLHQRADAAARQCRDTQASQAALRHAVEQIPRYFIRAKCKQDGRHYRIARNDEEMNRLIRLLRVNGFPTLIAHYITLEVGTHEEVRALMSAAEPEVITGPAWPEPPAE